MAVARMKFIDKEEEYLLHELSIEPLSDIGVLIGSPSVLKFLEDSGANYSA